MDIVTKRAYGEPSKSDGSRVLVDRLWPRGIKKETLALDEWCKGIAPSSELRRWFNHQPERFDEFRNRYIEELINNTEPRALLGRYRGGGKLTLVYAAKDPIFNHAKVLQEYLKSLL